MTKIRFLTAFILVGAAALFLAASRDGYPLTRICLAAETPDTIAETCQVAFASGEVSTNELGELLFEAGRAAHNNKPANSAKAVAFYSQAIAIYPDRTSAFFNRGLLLRAAGAHGPAIEDFTVVIDRMNAGGRYYEYAHVMRATQYRATEQYNFALEDVNAALAQDPTERDALIEKWRVFQAQKDYDGGLTVLDGAILAHPKDTWLLSQRSWVKFKLDDRDGALADINTAIAIGDDTAWTWYWRGRLLRLRGDVELALDDLTKALQIKPSHGRAHWEMRYLIEKMAEMISDDPKRIIALANKGMDENPDGLYFGRFLQLRYLVAAEQGRFDDALTDIDTLITWTDDPEPLLLDRADILASAERYDLALADLRALIRNREVYEAKAKRLLEQTRSDNNGGKTPSAATDRYVVLMTGIYRRALIKLFDMHWHLEDWDSAASALDLLLDYNPTNSRYWAWRGEVLEELGDTTAAIDNYNEVIRLEETGENHVSRYDQEHATNLLARGTAYQSLGRTTAAEADFSAALALGTAELISAFQVRVQDAGHYDGLLTGVVDDATRVAISLCANDPDCT